ncbi:MAG: ABC transporter ATP-binding protein [Bacilli bacterium]|nr:ABC transporter ATP-binding protein [Bacilli bacterium]
MEVRKKFVSLIKENKKEIVILSILNVLVSVFVVAFAYFSKEFIDSINSDKFYLFLGLLVASIVLEVGFKLYTSYLSFNYCAKEEMKLREETSSKLFSKRYESIKFFEEGELVQRIKEETRFVSSSVINLVPSSLLIISRLVLSFALLLVLDYIFGLALLGCGLIIFFVTFLLRKKNKKLHRLLQEKEAKVFDYYNESFINILAIKVFGYNKKLEGKEKEVNKELYEAKVNQNNFNIMINGGFLTIIRLSYVVAIIYCVFRLQEGMALGSLLAIVQLVGQFATPFSSLSSIPQTYHRVLASLERIEELTGLEEDKRVRLEEEFKSIDIKDLHYAYGDNIVLKGVDLVINKGEKILIKGGSGEGKSTLIKCILGEYVPLEGSVLINEEYSSNNIEGLFAYVPQVTYMTSGSIKENLELFKENELSYNSLEVVDLKEEIEKLPLKEDTLISSLNEGLSIGQLQRLSLARALESSREVILIDEGTSSLDEETEKKVLTNLSKLNKTIIFISHHNIDSYMDKVYELKEGKLWTR